MTATIVPFPSSAKPLPRGWSRDPQVRTFAPEPSSGDLGDTQRLPLQIGRLGEIV